MVQQHRSKYTTAIEQKGVSYSIPYTQKMLHGFGLSRKNHMSYHINKSSIHEIPDFTPTIRRFYHHISRRNVLHAESDRWRKDLVVARSTILHVGGWITK